MPKRRYTKELLDEILQQDGATLIGEYKKITRDIPINYKCKCGVEYTKMMRYIVEEAGALCKDCGMKHMVETQKKSMIDTYGASHPMLVPEFKKKQEETMIANYGVSNPMQNKEIKEKAIKTMNNRTIDEKQEINEKRKGTNKTIYGGNAPVCSLKIKEKIKQTSLKKYGTEHPNQNEDMKEKVANSNINKYGVKSTAQLKEVNEKARNTCLQKYGVISTALIPEVKQKQKETLQKNYGVEYSSQSPIIQEKIKITNIKKYGVERPTQNSEIMEKIQRNAKKYKEFKMPSGEIRKVQGYEPFALTDLLKVYTEEQIKTDRKEVPRIQYEVDGKKKYHFPDIFIPHEKKIVEVKSTWTYKCKTDNIQLKKKAAEEQGFVYEIWCYGAKGLKVPV